jgi:hypothetical protein
VELHYLYFQLNITGVIKSKRIILVGHAARMGEKMKAYLVLLGKPKGKRQSEVAGVERDNIKMVLKVLRKLTKH